MSKTVLVTGATGQTGSYMVDYLLENTDHKVICAIRRTSQAILSNLEAAIKNSRVKLVNIDLLDPHSIDHVVKTEQPDYFLNFGACSFVSDSWQNPALNFQANSIGLIHILESVRKHKPSCRIYSAGSSEQWGDVKYTPQDENHPMSPRSPYGCSKCAASLISKVWRESYGLYVVHGILLNHESKRRQEYFVTRKITKAVARICRAIKNQETFEPLKLGNINAKRDWSHASDFVDGIWRMMNQEEYRDDLKALNLTREVKTPLYWSDKIKEYVLSSNETHEIREFVEKAFGVAGITGSWVGNGLDEKFIISNYLNDFAEIKSQVLMEIDPQFFRPAEVELLLGNSDRARTELGWKPKMSFSALVQEMVLHDINNP